MSKKPIYPDNRIAQRYSNALKAPPEELPVEQLPIDSIQQEAKKRAKAQPMFQRLVKSLRGGDKSFRELVINSEPLEKRVALLVDGLLEKFEIEDPDEERSVGAIFKGHIQNLEEGLKAAFVDIGQEKNAFLHYWDILPESNDSSVEIVRENKSEAQQKRNANLSLKDIPKLYPVGTSIVVQIKKDQIGTKGPRVTTHLSLPGRFLVLTPNSGQCGISRKIEDPEERKRLRTIVNQLTVPEGMGVIVRTAGEGKRTRFFVRDLHILLKKWEVIAQKIQETQASACVYREPALIERTVRDFLTEEIDRVLIDNKEDYEEMLNYVGSISPRSRSKIVHFKEDIPIFERFNIERQIDQVFQRRVPLPSGGGLVIEETEALIAIDVNTGGHRSGEEDFIIRANMEAGREATRQIKLRNLGGVVIIDFIDMKNKKDRQAVYEEVVRLMENDKAKCHILPISSLGTMQMTRQRHQESTSSGLYGPCPYCKGCGVVKSSRTMSVEIQRRLSSLLRRLRSHNKEPQREIIPLRILLSPSVLERLRQQKEEHLIRIEDLYGVKLSFCADPAYHVENFKIIDIEREVELK